MPPLWLAGKTFMAFKASHTDFDISVPIWVFYQWGRPAWEGTSCRTLQGVRWMSGSARGPCVREPIPWAAAVT